MQPRLFELPMRGKRLPPKNCASFFPLYRNKDNVLYEGDNIEWLKSLSDETIDLIFADPPYNIKKADWDKFESQEKFQSISDYTDFCLRYLEFIQTELQAVIVSRNENHYRFFQYKKNGTYNVTRPINSNLML